MKTQYTPHADSVYSRVCIAYRTYDIAELFKDEYGSDEVNLFEVVEGLHTGSHEGLTFLFSPRGQVFQHCQQEITTLVHSLSPLHHQAERGGRRILNIHGKQTLQTIKEDGDDI